MANPQTENGYTKIANEIMDALAKIRIPGEARQVLDAIIRKTYGWDKKKDAIATSQFIALTGLKKGMIHRARKRLLYANLITVYKNNDSQVLSYSFQKDYTKWNRLYAKKTILKKVINCMQKSAQTVPNNEGHNIKKETIQKKEVLYVDFEKSTLTYWNSFCDKFPAISKVLKISESRRAKLKKRFSEGFDIETILKETLKSKFLLGENQRKWKISFDWLIENDKNCLKVLEGKYNDHTTEDDIRAQFGLKKE